jgi:uncharacterized OsmC-like protein
MEAIVDYLGGVQFAVSVRGHRVLSDQPVDNGGDDAGMTPPEYFLAALGACAGHYAAGYLTARSVPPAGLRVRVTADKATQPARLARFRIEIEAPGAEDPKHHEGVLRAVKKCLIHNTLANPPEMEIAVSQLATI